MTLFLVLTFGIAWETLAAGAVSFHAHQSRLARCPTLRHLYQLNYQLNTARRQTDITGNAYRLKLESISGSSFSLDLVYATTDVEDDLNAGTDLARDAESYYAKGGYRFTVSPSSFLIPSVIYIQHDADGSANSFDSYGTDISWFNILGKATPNPTSRFTMNRRTCLQLV